MHVLAITAEDEKTMFTGKKVAIIGGGKMGGILARGMITRKILSAQNITVTDIDPARLDDLRSSLKVQVTGGKKCRHYHSGGQTSKFPGNPQGDSPRRDSVKAVYFDRRGRDDGLY